MSAITPIGLRFAGKNVVVIGGGPVAARRARIFVQAGAYVTVIAPQVCADMTELLASATFAQRTLGTPCVTWLPREYQVGDLASAWFAATATGQVDVDDAVAHEAEQARIFCFKGADPEGATAWAPALHIDNDTTIAVISTGNTVPSPKRSMRVRDAIASFLLHKRTQLNEALHDTPSAAVPVPHHVGNKTGEVVLVGGGPGALELLTLSAREHIESADVLVIDRLAPRGALQWIGEHVEVLDVGKTGGHHPVSQADINRALIHYASLGKKVVRLKGGDPYVFGRGGEEYDACVAHGINVSVVPGVTSAVAVPGAAGIPVTHRGVSRGFSVITAHADLSKLPLAHDHTLVLLMGVAHIDSIAEQLIAQGNPHDTPCAIVEDGFGPRQRTTTATLATLAQRAREADVQPPAVIVVGDVVLRARSVIPVNDDFGETSLVS
ncbi:uroporphyrinogen-III C-methyltransferase [Timonella sp. A28]|uniref:uroporphyrinogen-III C-methyltransferase n=1 Tax=Timonella sp. A28 TaxID=3442640 RepID=UPI003EBFE613